MCSDRPLAPDNGAVVVSAGDEHTSVATFTCDAGYTLSGSISVICDASTNGASWPSSDASCSGT